MTFHSSWWRRLGTPWAGLVGQGDSRMVRIPMRPNTCTCVLGASKVSIDRYYILPRISRRHRGRTSPNLSQGCLQRCPGLAVAWPVRTYSVFSGCTQRAINHVRYPRFGFTARTCGCNGRCSLAAIVSRPSNRRLSLLFNLAGLIILKLSTMQKERDRKSK